MDAYPAEVAFVAGVRLSWVKSAYYQGTVPYFEEARAKMIEALRKINRRREEDGRPHLLTTEHLSESQLFPRKLAKGRPAKSFVFKG
jgi:hypothetical protein